MSLPRGYDAWLTTDTLECLEEPDQCRRCGEDTPRGAGLTDDCPVCVPGPTEGLTMQWSNDRDKIAPALVAALSELTNPPKDSHNPHFNSRFVSLDGLLDHVRPVLAKHGLAVMQPESSRLGADGKGVAVITTHFLHTSGQWCESTSEYGADRAGVQATGSATTYGRRYDLQGFCGLAGDPDLDGELEEQGNPEEGSPPARPALRDASAPREIRTPAAAPAAARRASSTTLKLPNAKPCGGSAGKPIPAADSADLRSFVQWQERVNYGDEKYRDLNIAMCDAAREELDKRDRERAAEPANAAQSRRAAVASGAVRVERTDDDPGFGDDDIPF